MGSTSFDFDPSGTLAQHDEVWKPPFGGLVARWLETTDTSNQRLDVMGPAYDSYDSYLALALRKRIYDGFLTRFVLASNVNSKAASSFRVGQVFRGQSYNLQKHKACFLLLFLRASLYTCRREDVKARRNRCLSSNEPATAPPIRAGLEADIVCPRNHYSLVPN